MTLKEARTIIEGTMLSQGNQFDLGNNIGPVLLAILEALSGAEEALSNLVPAYTLTNGAEAFIRGTGYALAIAQTRPAPYPVDVHVAVEGGAADIASFRSDAAPSAITVTPDAGQCVVNLIAGGMVVGSFTMSGVLTVPKYTLFCADTDFVQGREYAVNVVRDVAPAGQTQIEVSVTGGTVSPVFLVDEGEGVPLEDANSVILVTPSAITCTVTLKATLAGTAYSVGKFTMSNIMKS